MDIVTTGLLERHRTIWQQRPLLRYVYTQWYSMIEASLSVPDGTVIDVGCGSGNFKQWRRSVIAGDSIFTPWLDFQADAHILPFKDNSVNDLVAIDLLHHLHYPVSFLKEVQRVLRFGGRLHLIEPYPSLVSLPFYRRFHPEPFTFTVPDFFENVQCSGTTPNQAMACLLFFRYRRLFDRHFGKSMRIIKRERMATLLYPLSGGFEGQPLVAYSLRGIIQVLEILFKPLAPLMAFRCYVVCEKD